MINNANIYTELEIDSESNNKYVSIGNLLRNRRLDMNISLEDIALNLKLCTNYITLVEEGEYDAVSGKIYYFGYIRNLSRYLKLDEEMILRYLVEEIKIDDQALQYNVDNENNILNRSIILNSKNYKKNNYNIIYITVGVILFIVLSVSFIIKNQYEAQKEPITIIKKQQNIKL